MSSTPHPARIRDRALRRLFSDEPRQRVRQQRSLLASGVCLVAMAVIAHGMRSGFVPEGPGWCLIAYLGGGMGFFYFALRSRRVQQAQDPGMTLPQIAFAVTGMTAAYAVSGPVRGGFLMLLACSMVFGAFAPRRVHARNASAITLVGLAVVMVAVSVLDPLRYPAQTEAIHFLMFAVTLATIAAVAGQLSTARTRLTARNLELADALQRIHLLATRDELTGLANRRHMRERLASEIQRITRHQETACLCLIDLDLFKRVNDRYGHAAGDLVLQEFARIATDEVRQSDLFARWGGEEFLWLLLNTGMADARTAIERLRLAFAEAPAWQSRPELRTTLSAGLVPLQAGESVEQALDRADAMLYRAKSQGRDRMCA